MVGLLNYCLSGGNLEFMRRDTVRAHLGTARWPLFLMSSSAGDRESMVSGLWTAWFTQLGHALNGTGTGSLGSVEGLFHAATSEYYKEAAPSLVCVRGSCRSCDDHA